jgi:hypothetical protein
MKLKFKKQSFQTDAVNAVADCFAGQPKTEGVIYRIDPGKTGQAYNSTLYIFMAWWPAYHLICSMLFDKFSNIHFLQDKC